MADSYQAIYDAVRSRISNGNVGDAVESAMRDANFGHYMQMAAHAMAESFLGYTRPSAIYRPALSADGTMWCALYGRDLMEGVAGFGETPEKAMEAFDLAWLNAKTPAAMLRCRRCGDQREEDIPDGCRDPSCERIAP